jgi:hypothetical protein
MTHSFSVRFAFAIGLLFPVALFAAGIFPDVSDNNPHKGAIESLARAGIIKGNPNGTYSPDRTVNRAEFLKLLYSATNRTPTETSGCFSDVESGSWYELYVCDAASKENGFVNGYSDGKFRPASPVSRTEALKMIFTVFGLSTPDLSTQNQDIIKFVDISVSAWYTKYISTAYTVGVLPIAGQSGSRFYPEKELTRGEAAAYIFNAMHAHEIATSASSASDASSLSASSIISKRSSTSSSSAAPTFITKSVNFPLNDSSQFMEKKPVNYLFSLTSSKTVFHANVGVVGFYPSNVTCRLYLLKQDGFSDEYYLGVQSENTCQIKVSLRPGNYQLQVQPIVANVAYTVSTKIGTTDGNDGFIDAVTLLKNKVRTATLERNDLFDWYTVRTNSLTPVTVGVSSAAGVSCIIYTPPTVDQFGFSGPECDTPYSFVPGETYIVGIGRKNTDINTVVTYTISWY